MQDSTAFAPSPEDRRGPKDLLDLLTWVGRDPGLTPSNKAVLLAVVAHADEQGICPATDQALARASRTSIPTVQKTLRHFEGERVIQRSNRHHDPREIRLITGEHSLVVDDVEPGEKQQQQQDGPADCSPVSGPVEPDHPGPNNDLDEEAERLVLLLTGRGITEEVARGLVRDFPERIAAQVEAHKKRKVWNVAGSLVIAIRQNWASVRSQSPPSPKEQQEEARKEREADRKATLDAQAVENARRRAEDEKVSTYWDRLSQEQKDAFDEEAIEASTHREEIRSLDPGTPMFRGMRAAARWAHIRRKLGLRAEG